MTAALEDHKAEAARALAYHRNCLSGAAARYADLSTRFGQILAISSETRPPTMTDDATTKEFIEDASNSWFDVSSDYQQDKVVPSWNESPQPGPTYFMSGETHYVHIFCAESCGYPTGPPRFSRSLIYSRSERVGGSKSSDRRRAARWPRHRHRGATAVPLRLWARTAVAWRSEGIPLS